MLPEDRNNGILFWSHALGGRNPEDVDGDQKKFLIQKFEKMVIFACLLTVQIKAAQILNEDEEIAEALFSDNDVQLPAYMIRMAAGKFVQMMDDLNKGSLLSMVDERSEKCCYELRENTKIFQAAAHQLANTPQFVRTIIAVADGLITNLEPAVGVWPAEMADHAAASRSLNASARVVEKKSLMGPPMLPRKINEADKKMTTDLEDLEVNPKDSMDSLMKLAQHAQIENQRRARQLPSQKESPMMPKSKPVKPEGIFKNTKANPAEKSKPERKGKPAGKEKSKTKGDKGAEAMFAFGWSTPPESESENSSSGGSPKQGEEKPYKKPSVEDYDDEN